MGTRTSIPVETVREFVIAGHANLAACPADAG